MAHTKYVLKKKKITVCLKWLNLVGYQSILHTLRPSMATVCCGISGVSGWYTTTGGLRLWCQQGFGITNNVYASPSLSERWSSTGKNILFPDFG